MQLRAALLGFVWLAALGARAGEPGGAPLEGAKQELQKLQADQAAKNGAAVTDRLAEGMPQIQTPIPGAAQLEAPALEKMEKDRKRKAEAQKNWLLNGVDRLGRGANDRHKGREAPEAEAVLPDEEKEPADSSDPDYLLQVYTEQKKLAEAKAGETRPAAPRADPLAPFLQDWLATSPVRGKFFDDFVRRPDAAGGAPGPGPAESAFNRSAGPLEADAPTRRVAAAAQPNPYLRGLDTPALQDLGADRPSGGMVNFSAGPAPVRSSEGGRLEPISANQPAEKKKLQLPPSEDKKYFPQLKKF